MNYFTWHRGQRSAPIGDQKQRRSTQSAQRVPTGLVLGFTEESRGAHARSAAWRRDEGRRERSGGQPLTRPIRTLLRPGVNLDRRVRKIDDPDLGDIEFCVERELSAPVISQRAFGDFDEEEDVGAARVALS